MNYPEFALYFPLKPGTKVPLVKGWQALATNDAGTIAKWKAEGYGIAAMPAEGYAVLDLDVKSGTGTNGIAWAKDNRPALPETWSAETAGGGQHHWFKLPDGIRMGNKTGFNPGMDIRAAGKGFVVFQATIYGKAYKQHSATVADCPQWIIEDAKAAKQADKFDDDGSAVIEYKGAAVNLYKEALAHCAALVETGADGWDDAANTLAWYTAHMMCHAESESEADRLQEAYLNHELVRDLDDNSDTGKRGSSKLDYKLAILRPQYSYREELEQDKEAEFWASTPTLQRVARVAEISSANPWAVLGNALSRAAVTTSCNVRADRRFTGGKKGGNLNLFIAPCGPAGAGKGEAFKAAEAVFHWPEVKEINIGSGEALLMNLKKTQAEYAEDGGTFYQGGTGLLIRTGEVGELGAKGNRQGSTLWEYLKQAYSGEALRNSTIAGKSDADIEDNSYRVAVSIDVQPLKADILLEQSDGGLPQRFAWFDAKPSKVVRAADRTEEMLTELDDAPVFSNPFGAVVEEPVFVLFPEIAFRDYDADKEARLARDESEDNDDAHAFYTRIKVAALLAILHGKKEVSEKLWEHSGYVMEHSGKRLDKCRALLASQETDKQRKRAQSMATLEHYKGKVQKELTQAELPVEGYAKVVLEELKESGRTARRDFNAKVNGTLRPKRNDAIELLIKRGAITEEKEGRKVFLSLAA